MDQQVVEIGNERQKVLIFDEVLETPGGLVELAKSLAPFPPVHTNSYPGNRLVLEPSHGPQVHAYIDGMCKSILPFMKEVYGIKGFSVNEASFSMITVPPDDLTLRQRVPHFDTSLTATFAVLHYLCDARHGGTAFYRHRTTGFEVITSERRQMYEQALAIDLDIAPPPYKYFDSTDGIFEKIYEVGAVFNRLVLYRSRSLHSGLLGSEPSFSDDPEVGRLTTNLFLHAR